MSEDVAPFQPSAPSRDMSNAAAPPARDSFLSKVRRWAVFAVVMVVGFAAWEQMTGGADWVDTEALTWWDLATSAAVLPMMVGGVLFNTGLLDRLPHGPIRAPYEAGLAWTHSVAFRLIILFFGVGFFAICIRIAGIGFQAAQMAEWLRLALAVAFTLFCLFGAVSFTWLAFSRSATMGIDPEGLEDDDVRLAWSEIEKIGVKRRLSDRRVELFLIPGHPLGAVHRFSLRDVGLTAGEFFDKVQAIAPQVVIERPAGKGAGR